jgi:hypothetical protein
MYQPLCTAEPGGGVVAHKSQPQKANARLTMPAENFPWVWKQVLSKEDYEFFLSLHEIDVPLP